MSDIPVNILFGVIGGPESASAISSMMAVIGQLKDEFIEAAQDVDRFDDMMAHLKIPIDEASEALDNQVEKMSLMQAANRLTQAGVEATSNQFRAMAVRAKEVADATGQEFEPVMQALTRAVITGKDRFHQFNLEGDDTQSMLSGLVRELGDAGVEADSTADKIDSLTNSFNDWFRDVERGVTEGGPINKLMETLEAISESITELAGGTGGLADLAAGFVNLLIELNPITFALEMIRDLLDAIAVFGRHLRGVTLTGNPMQDAISISGALSEAQAEAGGRMLARQEAENPISDGRSSAGGQVATGARGGAGSAGRRTRAGGGGGGGGRGRGEESGTRSVEDFLELAGIVSITREGGVGDVLAGEGGEGDLEDFLKREAFFYEQSEKREQEHTELVKKFAKEREEARMSEMDAFGNQVSAFGGFFSQMVGIFGEHETARHLIEGTSETVLAAISWAKVANPFGGQVFIPEALAHTAAAAMAFAAAANPKDGAGRGAPAGAGAGGFTGARASDSFGGSAPPIVLNMRGIATDKEVGLAVRAALIASAQGGSPLPMRAIGGR